MIYGEGNYSYRPIEGWGARIKKRWPNIQEIAGVTVDDEDCVYLLTRTDPPVIKTDREGNVLCTFGKGVFTRPHGIYVTRNGSIFGVDDKAHAVYRFDEQFQLVQTLGTPGKASDTGSSGKYTEVTHGGPPFNRPTRICEDEDIIGIAEVRHAERFKLFIEVGKVDVCAECGKRNACHCAAVLFDDAFAADGFIRCEKACEKIKQVAPAFGHLDRPGRHHLRAGV